MPPVPLAPLILQRADPCIRFRAGWYYFTASVPAYDCIELRRARTIAELPRAEPVIVWRKPDTGPCSQLVWAPEIHFVQGQWRIYFASAHTGEIKDGLFQHRMWRLSTPAENPLDGPWSGPERVDTGMDTFCLDATSFSHRGADYYVWAQKDEQVPGNSNLYIARLATATTLATRPVMLSRPEFPWETVGFAVNEGPSVLVRHGRIFLTYSASATGVEYAMGMLWADGNADLLDARSWTKSPEPVLCSDPAHRIFGPGHNSFTIAEDGATDLLVYHARITDQIIGDPLWDPNRHTFVKPLRWSATGLPIFGRPSFAD